MPMRNKRYGYAFRKGILLLLTAALLLGVCGAQAAVYVNEETPEDWNSRELFRLTVFRTADSDCMLLESGGETMLVDGGFSRYGETLYQRLREMGIGQLDALFVTHPHDDHISGALEMLKHGMKTKTLYSVFPEDYADPLFSTLTAKAREAGAEFRLAKNNDQFLLGNALCHVIVWGLEDMTSQDNNLVNAHSAMLRLEYRGSTLLLTADISQGTQKYFLENLEPYLLKADILKANHHGRNQILPDFLEAVEPKMIFCNNKRDNALPLFNQARGAGIPLLFSASGTLIMESDGQDWYVRQINGF